jgi:uncharacterized membrane protein
MIKQYLTSLVIFTVIDGLWLGFIAPKFYQSHIGHLMKPQADFVAAGLFYLFYLIGLSVFVINPHQASPLLKVGAYGAFFGCVTYATFDLTSVAVFKGFPYKVAIVDMLWGSLLCAMISVLTVWFTRA